MSLVYTSRFGNHTQFYNTALKVALVYGHNDHQVYFEVDNSFNWENRKNKVAITRWLLDAWTQLLMVSPKQYIVCYPASHDSKGEYRIGAYLKMGFVMVTENAMVWGNTHKYFSDMMAELDEKEEYGGNPDDI